jgi:DNA-binding MarR family transcriptional regulator
VSTAQRTRRELSPAQLEAWTRFLRAHSSITRELEAQLASGHELTLSDYDVLVQLAQAPGRRLRPVELARAVLLTRSGVTRLVHGLERAGLVERIAAPEDLRGSLVHLTPEGRDVLRRASRTHLQGVRERFADRFDAAELATLSDLLGRLLDDGLGQAPRGGGDEATNSGSDGGSPASSNVPRSSSSTPSAMWRTETAR